MGSEVFLISAWRPSWYVEIGLQDTVAHFFVTPG
jgi:hypothetical protein